MPFIRYTIGLVAGILDGFGMIRARNAILATVKYDGSTMDGFDRAADWF